jgi:glycine cleavage system aminomethyltransferase T
VGFVIGGERIHGISDWHDVRLGDTVVGTITEAVHSPRLLQNIGVGMLSVEFDDDVEGLEVSIDGERRPASIAALPFC